MREYLLMIRVRYDMAHERLQKANENYEWLAQLFQADFDGHVG